MGNSIKPSKKESQNENKPKETFIKKITSISVKSLIIKNLDSNKETESKQILGRIEFSKIKKFNTHPIVVSILKEKNRIFEDLKNNPLRFSSKAKQIKDLKQFNSLKNSQKILNSVNTLDLKNSSINTNQLPLKTSIVVSHPEKFLSLKELPFETNQLFNSNKSILKQKKKKIVDLEKLKEFEQRLNDYFTKKKEEIFKIENLPPKLFQDSYIYLLQTGGILLK